MKGGLRLHWDATWGWILDVPVTLSHEQIVRVVTWALPHQIDRWRSLPHGEKREELGKALDRLKRGEIHQRLIDADRDGIMIPFAASERVHKERTYIHG